MKRKCARRFCDNNASHKNYCKKHSYALGLSQPMRPSSEASEVVKHLRKNGWSTEAIIEASGIGSCTLYDIEYRKYDQCNSYTLESLEKLLPQKPLPIGSPSCLVTTRKLQSLQASGHSGAMISRETGIGIATINNLSLGKVDTTRASHITAVDKYWARWVAKGVIGNPNIAARRFKWVLPMEWNDMADPAEIRPGNSAVVYLTNGNRETARKLVEEFNCDNWPFEEVSYRAARRIVNQKENNTSAKISRFLFSQQIKATERLRRQKKIDLSPAA